MASTHTEETIPPILMNDLLMILGTGILTMFLFFMAPLFSFMRPCEMARSGQNTCIMCAELDDPVFCMLARGFFIVSIGCSIIAIAQGSLRDLNASHFAFMAAGAATTGYFATCKLRQTCRDLHFAQPR